MLYIESACTERSTPCGAQVRNNNSSRFGKFVEMHFDYNNALMGATIQARSYGSVTAEHYYCDVAEPARPGSGR